MIKKIFVGIVFCVLFVLLGYSGYKILLWRNDNKKTDQMINEVLDRVYNVDESLDNVNTTAKIDFNEMFSINEETVGWIEINNTNINYPIVRHKDNDFYLSHSLDKSYSDAGWVFLDFRNNLQDLSQNSIVYAHGRVDGSMFGSLKNIFNEEYFRSSEHNVYIYTPLRSYTFEVFSFYKIRTTDDYLNVDFSSSEEFMSFVEKLKKRSAYDFSVSINENDRIITLSTCYNNSEKLVLHAKLKGRV